MFRDVHRPQYELTPSSLSLGPLDARGARWPTSVELLDGGRVLVVGLIGGDAYAWRFGERHSAVPSAIAMPSVEELRLCDEQRS